MFLFPFFWVLSESFTGFHKVYHVCFLFSLGKNKLEPLNKHYETPSNQQNLSRNQLPAVTFERRSRLQVSAVLVDHPGACRCRRGSSAGGSDRKCAPVEWRTKTGRNGFKKQRFLNGFLGLLSVSDGFLMFFCFP